MPLITAPSQTHADRHKKLLVPGGAGFIGSHLVRIALRDGYHVTAVDNMVSHGPTEKPWWRLEDVKDHPFLEIITGDYATDELLKRVTAGEFVAVLHFAGIPRVSYSVEFPQKTFEENISKTMKMIEAVRHSDGRTRFIFSSSSSVYGGAEVLPTPPDHPKNPKSPYALQKSIIEEVLSLYGRLYDLDAVSLRYFNVFGSHQLGTSPYSTAIAAWCQALKDGRPLRSDGTGEQSRDLCHVDNVVDANLKAVARGRPFRGERYNVACGDRTSNNEILEAFKKRFPNVQVVHAPWRAGDVMHTHADISATTADLGYLPLVRFWDGFEQTLQWWGF